jgi:hypothetical protein
MDMSKDTFLVGRSCNSNNNDFEEMTGERRRRRLLGV